jgi:3-dehydroquinate synthase
MQALIVSDANVDALYGAACEAALRAQGLNARRAVVPAGEASKDLGRAAALCSAAAQAGLDRSSWIAALGGGMVGDLAGFVAAVYLRGVRCLHIPTTLLAMVDSSVGGKTGVNLPEGKNLVGAFHQPQAVAADLDTLETLPEREYLSGLAEVVKYGLIYDAEFFALVERGADTLLLRDKALLETVVSRCCEIKAEIVAADEKERGDLRALLNFGHTLGHALENAEGYGRWLHGEAVAIGMAYALELSCAARGLPRAECERARTLLRKLRLPVRRDGGAALWTALRRAMAADKKTLDHKLRFVLLERIGRAQTGCDVKDNLLAEKWHVCCE